MNYRDNRENGQDQLWPFGSKTSDDNKEGEKMRIRVCHTGEKTNHREVVWWVGHEEAPASQRLKWTSSLEGL